MTKVQLKSDPITPFGGLFFVAEQFKVVEQTVDKVLGLRCPTMIGYQYSEILRTMMCNFFCGGDRTEDVNIIKQRIGKGHGLKLCSPDTVLRMITELATPNITYTSDKGNKYQFNAAEELNLLLLEAAIETGQLVPGRVYDLDFDHVFLKAEKFDARRTYKGMLGYGPAVAVLTDVETGEQIVVGIENRDGNANVKFHQDKTLKRILDRLSTFGIKVRNARMDCGSYSKAVVKLLLTHCKRIFIRAEMSPALRAELQRPQVWRKAEINDQSLETTSVAFTAFGEDAPNCRLVVQRVRRQKGEQLDLFNDDDEYIYRAILTNEKQMTEPEVITYYNQRGAKERIFDQLNNDFGWRYLPKSEMNQNAVFMLLSAIIRNFYEHLLRTIDLRKFGVSFKTRMKAFIAKVIAVPAKWVRTGRQNVLNLYNANPAYVDLYYAYG